MSEWNVCCIDDLGTVNRGKSKHRPRNDSILFGGLYPFIQTADVKKANLYITEYNETYSDIGLAQSKLWDKGTLCITIAANIAESAILGIDACFPDSVVGFIPHKGKSDLKFVKYLLDEFKVYMQQISKGTTQDNLSLEKLRRVKFNVPEYSTQVKIANILSTYDDLIENNNRRIALLEKAAQELYKEWFVRKRNSAWEYIRLSDFGYSLESGSRPKGGIDASLQDGYPSLGAEAIGKLGEFDYSSTKLVPEDFYKKMKRGIGKDKDILLYKDGAYIGKVTLFMDGFPYKDYSINEHVFLMRSNEPLYQHYLYFTLALPQYFTQMQNLNRNAAQPGLTGKDIDTLKLYRPDEDTIRKFNSAIEPMMHNIFSLAKKNQILIKQRDLLLPRLMSCEIGKKKFCPSFKRC